MKKDALYYGIFSALVAFILMIVTLVWEGIKGYQNEKKAFVVKKEEVVEVRDPMRFAGLKIINGVVDGAPMVLVSEGTFVMGSPPVESDPDESPQRTIFLNSFYMDLYEVTHGQYKNYLKAIVSDAKPVVPVFMDNPALITKDDQPVNGVSWTEARNYCQWAGKRLPTEAEWEKAARGERGLKWPWGNEWVDKAANVQGEEDGFKYTAPPGKFEKGRSPYGLYDMAGNIGEWVEDWYDGNYYLSGPFQNPRGPEKGKFKGYRGGSWDDGSMNVRTAKRFQAAPHQTSAVIGFRCAKDL
ncbi:MAG: formylglycine-generating enzyme family protein [Nitrospirae bacterium]|nr:formylglycine-generating enzyme family protein [Nitrospirota bacterium]MBI3350970.1 formylglycine-generating enzyme family protein [Nitrospirota bacterium]